MVLILLFPGFASSFWLARGLTIGNSRNSGKKTIPVDRNRASSPRSLGFNTNTVLRFAGRNRRQDLIVVVSVLFLTVPRGQLGCKYPISSVLSSSRARVSCTTTWLRPLSRQVLISLFACLGSVVCGTTIACSLSWPIEHRMSIRQVPRAL